MTPIGESGHRERPESPVRGSFLAALTAGQLGSLRELGVVRGFERGTPLFHERQVPDSVMLLPRLQKGTKLRRVKEKLVEAGCTAGKLTRKSSKRIPRGRLIKLKTKPETVLDAGTPIDIVVSSGPD